MPLASPIIHAITYFMIWAIQCIGKAFLCLVDGGRDKCGISRLSLQHSQNQTTACLALSVPRANSQLSKSRVASMLAVDHNEALCLPASC